MIPKTQSPNVEIPAALDLDVLRWLQAIYCPDTGISFMPLRPGDKRPIWTKAMFLRQMATIRASGNFNTVGIDAVLGWLNQGWNVGICLVWSSLWVLDIDGYQNLPETVQDLLRQEDIPQVSTPSGGRHLFFSLPPDLVTGKSMKAHVLHPVIDGVKLPVDLKLGGGYTYTVAPGSHTSKGLYVQTTPWSRPPIIDPREVIPGIQIFKPTPGGDRGPRKRWDKDSRDLADRLQAAYGYLRKAPASVSTKGGPRSLVRAVVHLLNYLDLDPKLVIHILTHPVGRSWNDRCLNGKTGHPYPWTKAELNLAIESCRGLPPAAGIVRREQRIKNERRDSKLDRALMILKTLVDPDGAHVPVAHLREAVCKVMKIPPAECTANRFGRLLRKSGIKIILYGRMKSRGVRLTPSHLGGIRKHLEANS